MVEVWLGLRSKNNDDGCGEHTPYFQRRPTPLKQQLEYFKLKDF